MNLRWQGVSLPFLFGESAMKQILATAILFFSIFATAQAEPVWVTQGFESGTCKELATGNVDEGQDYIVRQCQSFPKVSTYTFYQEGTRLSIGFGTKPNTAFGSVDATRGKWPVVWGGEKRGKNFTPLVAIARFTIAGEESKTEHLLVFRLLDNGMSCVVGDVRKNQEANAVASAAMKKWKCVLEPTPIELK
jgi:hypothetical protein